MLKLCVFCGKEFDGRKNQKFCCRDCSSKSQTNKVEVDCEHCGKTILKQPNELKSYKHHYCSRECRDTHTGILQTGENHPMWNGGEKYFNCEMCGKEHHYPQVVYDKSKHHYCSPECRYKGISQIYIKDKRYNYSMQTTKCDYCGKEVMKKLSRVKRNNKNFCSIECSSEYCSENYIGSIRYNYKPELSDEERIANKTRHNSRKYRKWMRDVFKRDDYTCAITNVRGKGDLSVHHLDGWNWCKEKRYDVSNGIIIRKEIHELFHKIYGLGDNTKEQFEEFKNRYLNNDFKSA